MAFGRRFRAVLGVAATWGVAFSVVSTTLLLGGLAVGVIPSSIFGVREVVAVATRGLLVGGLAGAAFAMMLSRAERRRTLAALSTGRVAAWGFLGAVFIPVVLGTALGITRLVPLGVLVAGSLVNGAIGGMLGAATIRLARRAPAVAGEIEGGGG